MDKWNEWYKDLDVNNPSTFRYGDTETYSVGYNFLKGCKVVEDWGCGTGGFKRLFVDPTPAYVGIDGSLTPFADVKADLVNYTSSVEGIFMRHVLENNYEWACILENACKSFTRKMCLVLFTPFSDTTATEIAHNRAHGVDVPDLSLSKKEIMSIINKHNIRSCRIETKHTATGYGVEHIFYLTKHPLNMAFYTCFYGSDNNNAFRIPPIPSETYDCYFYTNNRSLYAILDGSKWIRIFDDRPTTDDLIESCFAAKHVKVNPHSYAELRPYDYTCFLDSKYVKISDTAIEQFVRRFFIEQGHALCVREHWFITDSVWREYEESMLQSRYVLEKEKYAEYIGKQVASGLKDIAAPHCSCGLLIRNMKHPKIKELNATWYEHIKECGIQDQISFFFVKQLYADCIATFKGAPM
jgi:hypothetical protein